MSIRKEVRKKANPEEEENQMAEERTGNQADTHAQARPILLADESDESSTAAIKLVSSDLPFTLVPNEGRGVVLYSSRGTFRGIDGIERYIEEKKATR